VKSPRFLARLLSPPGTAMCTSPHWRIVHDPSGCGMYWRWFAWTEFRARMGRTTTTRLESGPIVKWPVSRKGSGKTESSQSQHQAVPRKQEYAVRRDQGPMLCRLKPASAGTRRSVCLSSHCGSPRRRLCKPARLRWVASEDGSEREPDEKPGFPWLLGLDGALSPGLERAYQAASQILLGEGRRGEKTS